jgi:hypothetical protein
LPTKIPTVDPSEEFVEVTAGELPLEGLGKSAVVVLEGEKAFPQLLERGEVVGRQSLSLKDREVDFHLIEPTGVDGGWDHDDIGPLALESPLAGLSTMRRAIVDNPEHPSGRAIGWLTHDLVDEAVKRGDSGRELTTTVDLGPSHIPSCQVSPSAQPLIFVLNANSFVRLRRQGGMAAMTGLNAGFLISAEHTVLWEERLAFPDPFVQIQDPSGLLLEVRVPGKDPTPVAPRLDRILGEPAPESGVANRSDEAPTESLSFKFWNRVARQGEVLLLRKLAG